METGQIGVLFGLFFFGVAYNQFVGWLGARKEGYTAYLVAVGVAVTLAGLGAVYSWQAAMWAALCFVASGAPMMLGEAWRHGVSRWQDIERERREALRTIEQLERDR